MSKEMLRAFEALEEEKGIKKEVIIEALEAALISAYKRHYGQSQNVEVSFDEKKGDIHVYSIKEVVETSLDDTKEISLSQAREINRAYEVGDQIRFEVTPKNFGRIAAQTAKQVIIQRIREAERSMIYNEFIGYEDEVLTASVERADSRFVVVNLGKIQGVISHHDQMPGEEYTDGKRIKVYVTRVENSTKGPQIFVSRTHQNLLKRLFEQEVPEIYDGVVEIMSIAREAGDRSKVAVRSLDSNIDPVGTCVGPRGQRVEVIVNELNGENMDIVKWEKEPKEFIANALKPANVIDVRFDADEEKSCIVIVPDNQLSLAIGKRGQNARLAAKLTNYRIDIKCESEAASLFPDLEEGESSELLEDTQDVTEDQTLQASEKLSDEVLASEGDQEEIKDKLASEGDQEQVSSEELSEEAFESEPQ
ncbi:transcription termination/antitermination protein NusA [Atopobacter sp. AH10]|uniref:transcription termination factor NusA n=1 Tax=Atopobacter sp. AH10 TaxID=2315861 RepID=UPI000EF1D696|nr:transcription termination factor NusA [Atopobacter sp. AH10]RLK62445.1 transcription termination/antitermination protein NusA [Atopobacter sp. AH10]